MLQDEGLSIPEFPFYAVMDRYSGLQQHFSCCNYGLLKVCVCCALDRFMPGVDETKLFPIEGMHLEGDGVLTAEGYQMLYMLIKKRGYFSLERANARIKNAPKSLWRDGVCIRPIHPSVLKGQKGGRPSSDQRMRYTAAEMHKFAHASVSLFDDMIPNDEPVWQCWKVHVAYFELMLQPSFTFEDIILLDKLIFDHQTLYSQVYPCAHPM